MYSTSKWCSFVHPSPFTYTLSLCILSRIYCNVSLLVRPPRLTIMTVFQEFCLSVLFSLCCYLISYGCCLLLLELAFSFLFCLLNVISFFDRTLTFYLSPCCLFSCLFFLFIIFLHLFLSVIFSPCPFL